MQAQRLLVEGEEDTELVPNDDNTFTNFGYGVAIWDDIVVVSQPTANGGSVYAFHNGASGWEQTSRFQGSDTASGDLFG